MRRSGEYSGALIPAFFRWLNQSAAVPCGSVSEMTTGPSPARSAAAARCTVTVDFPEPPF